MGAHGVLYFCRRKDKVSELFNNVIWGQSIFPLIPETFKSMAYHCFLMGESCEKSLSVISSYFTQFYF